MTPTHQSYLLAAKLTFDSSPIIHITTHNYVAEKGNKKSGAKVDMHAVTIRIVSTQHGTISDESSDNVLVNPLISTLDRQCGITNITCARQ